MKFKLFFILFLNLSFSCFAQFNLSKIVLKSGDTIHNVRGKFKAKHFSYRTYSGAKPVKILFEKIESVEMKFSKNDIKVYYFFNRKDKERIVPVQRLETGKHMELYGSFYSVKIPGNSFSTNAVKYYIKTPNEEQITMLGVYGDPFGRYKDNVYKYFSDCEKLIKNLKAKKIKLGEINNIVAFYNEKCFKTLKQ